MMMMMIAGFVDSITTPIKSWLDSVANSDEYHKTTNITVKEFGVDSSRVDCIVCLSDVAVGERYAMLERCKHGFHVECVEAWLKDHPNCPLCRTLVSGAHHEHQPNNHMTRVYLRKLYEIMSCYGFRVLETMASWLTKSFSQGLDSTLSESCNYL